MMPCQKYNFFGPQSLEKSETVNVIKYEKWQFWLGSQELIYMYNDLMNK